MTLRQKLWRLSSRLPVFTATFPYPKMSGTNSHSRHRPENSFVNISRSSTPWRRSVGFEMTRAPPKGRPCVCEYRYRSLLRLVEPRGDFVPVDDVPPGIDVVLANVLVLQVVGV